MKFNEFAKFLSELEKTASRIKITEILARLFQKSTPEEIDKICYLSLGRLAPQYAGIEFNLADKLIIRVLAQAFNESPQEISRKYKQLGDLGDTTEFFDFHPAKASRDKQNSNLSVNEVYQWLWEVAKDTGNGSVERKISLLASLIDDLDALSAKYVTRIPLGRLRLGFSELTLMDALSWVLTGNKDKREEIETAYNVHADIGHIARIIKKQGLIGLKGIKVSLGVPIVPALCQRLPNTEEMIKKMAKVAVEPKYDGTRLQLHFDRSKNFIKTFTRNLEDSTLMFPDITQAVFGEVKAGQAILDGEAIGLDQKTGKFLPFQETIKRKRKYEVSLMAKEIPLKYFVFDILYKDGQDLLNTPFAERREILTKILSADGRTIRLSPQIVTESVEDLRHYHNEQKNKGLEGIVAKKWQGTYDPGRRGYNWVKFKEDTSKKGGGLNDTLDCIVMGYSKGKGKRAKFGIGAFLVGIRKSVTSDQFLTISKIGTGLTDEQWRELKTKCEPLAIGHKPKEYQVNKNLAPDVWCVPGIVVEIQADNLSVSPIHTAGLAFRFPRLKHFRDDKRPDQASTLAEVRKLYQMQK
jgi:DNA ligase-1